METNDKEIVFSRTIKAGKRIYYLDVKKNRRDEMFLAVTESKKVVTGEGQEAQVNFEKHKIFLYQEDFQRFMAGLTEAMGFIEQHNGPAPRYASHEADEKEGENREWGGEIKIDIDF